MAFSSYQSDRFTWNPLRLLSRTAANRSIEAVVLGFVMVTLAYFQLLHAVKHSEFLNPSTSTMPLDFRIDGLHESAILARTASGNWEKLAVGSSSEAIAVHLNRIVVSLDADLSFEEDDRNVLVFPEQTSTSTMLSEHTTSSLLTYAKNVSISDHEVLASLEEFERHLRTSSFGSSSIRFQPELCLHPSSSQDCFVVPFYHPSDSSSLDRSAMLSLAFKPSTEAQEWSHQLLSTLSITDSRGNTYIPSTSFHGKREDAGLGLSFKAFPHAGGLAGAPSPAAVKADESRSFKWIFYASRAFVMRLWALARKADSADIFVMLIGYILMHLTFINLFINMRKLGSKFWLGCSTLVSGTFALLLALFTAYLLGVTINPIVLSEALPFLVITVGFEKPFVLARAVFTNPALMPVSNAPSLRSRLPSRVPSSASRRVSTFNFYYRGEGGEALKEPVTAVRTKGIRWATPVPARDIVMQGFDKTGRQIVRDYAIEIAVLLAGSFAGIPGLKEFCQLASLILFFDCLFLFGFFASVLTVMVEVRRIRIMRGLRRVDSSADLAHILDDGTTPDLSIPESAETLTTGQKLSQLLLGTPSSNQGKGESPTARLKLLLISAFLILHALNLCTTLTAKTAFTRHSAASSSSSTRLSPSSVYNQYAHTDPYSTTLNPVLESLSALYPANDIPLVVQIAPPIFFRLVLPGMSSSDTNNQAYAILADKTKVASSMAILDRFMSGWTKLVGDPVLSKWIVIILVVSVFLNGYLLKGIAVGDQGTGEGFVPSSAPEAATRLLLGGQGQSSQQKLKRRWSGGIEGLAKLQTEWSLADAAEMAKERRKELIETEKERDAAHAQSSKIKDASQKAAAIDNDSSDESVPGSPLFITTKKRSTTYVTGRLISANEGTGASTSPLTPALGENVKFPPSTSTFDSSSEPAIDTPATTVFDDTENASVTPTVHLYLPPRDIDIVRPLDDIISIFAQGKGADAVTDEEVILLVQKGKVAAYALEKLLKDNIRAVRIRRALISRASTTKTLETSHLPYLHYDYSKVMGQCCENVVGFIPIPIGVAGPLRIDGVAYPIPMATTEGALVASTSRGCKALNAGGGVTTVVTQDAMTRGPALDFPSILQCAAAKRWIDSEEGSTIMKAAFNSTSRYARLQSLKTAVAGRTLFVRFATQTGDAMGMNMISKGTERALETMGSEYFPDMKVTSLSGNYCTDKKPAAINWIEGRGKSVVAEGIVPGNIVKTILKTTVQDLVKINITKNLVGSAMAGTMGGNNAHASNILTAIFLATGQDPAQNVESSNCMTLMEAINDGEDLLITCTMPSIEVGTIGGGTILPPQHSMLTMLGVDGPHLTNPGDNARKLARIICASVIAGELSLMSSLAQGSLVQSHMALNRSAPATPATVQITGHSYLTPAPTRPGTPSIGSSSGNGRQINHIPSMTPLSLSTPASSRKSPSAFPF